MTDPIVAALLSERASHEAAGRRRRVALVDAELAKRGHRPTAEPLETTAASPPPETTAEPRGGDHVCDDCGATARSPAGLAAHRRGRHPKVDDE